MDVRPRTCTSVRPWVRLSVRSVAPRAVVLRVRTAMSPPVKALARTGPAARAPNSASRREVVERRRGELERLVRVLAQQSDADRQGGRRELRDVAVDSRRARRRVCLRTCRRRCCWWRTCLLHRLGSLCSGRRGSRTGSRRLARCRLSPS